MPKDFDIQELCPMSATCDATVDSLEHERDKYRDEAHVLTYERDQAIAALKDAYTLLPPERVRLLLPKTAELIGLVLND